MQSSIDYMTMAPPIALATEYFTKMLMEEGVTLSTTDPQVFIQLHSIFQSRCRGWLWRLHYGDPNKKRYVMLPTPNLSDCAPISGLTMLFEGKETAVNWALDYCNNLKSPVKSTFYNGNDSVWLGNEAGPLIHIEPFAPVAVTKTDSDKAEKLLRGITGTSELRYDADQFRDLFQARSFMKREFPKYFLCGRQPLHLTPENLLLAVETYINDEFGVVLPKEKVEQFTAYTCGFGTWSELVSTHSQKISTAGGFSVSIRAVKGKRSTVSSHTYYNTLPEAVAAFAASVELNRAMFGELQLEFANTEFENLLQAQTIDSDLPRNRKKGYLTMALRELSLADIDGQFTPKFVDAAV